MEIYIPPALVLGCNTPTSIGVLSDYIQEQTGHPLVINESGWSDFVKHVNTSGYGYGYGYGYGSNNSYVMTNSSGYGNGCGYKYGSSNGNGYGYGYNFGCGYGNSNGNN